MAVEPLFKSDPIEMTPLQKQAVRLRANEHYEQKTKPFYEDLVRRLESGENIGDSAAHNARFFRDNPEKTKQWEIETGITPSITGSREPGMMDRSREAEVIAITEEYSKQLLRREQASKKFDTQEQPRALPTPSRDINTAPERNER